ncbi:MAG: pentapeptide repeat-containing protein [Brasilonema octagenarum HA4186-MV1]|jgi:KaiC/GvpD/RAD55 family RecA-like ATPase|nr:pentapeptide repeat-containing protein [Brasilonema octagenarum HA4186-MV1]
MSHNTSKTILILAANPTSTARLRLDEEVREIDLGLQLAKNRERFRLVQKWAVRQRDFYRAILEYQPQIIHFCGHGTGEDGIVLEDETGQPVLIEQEALAKLFKLFAVKGVECVVLNACFSEKQAQAISQYIKYVIGMNKTIGDKAAVNFAVAFYDALAAGNEVPFAHELGCAQLVGLKEDQTPVLKVSSIHPADIEFVAGDIPPNPYLGLSAFDEKDAAFFFGRETFTEELFQMTHQQPLVAVIGASGSGKSSVVFAGLIPKLREEGIWLIESFRPKSQPFDELALALVRQLEPDINKVEKAIQVGRLAESLKKGEVKLHQVASQVLENKPNKRFLLVVDQFEELYTQYQDKEEQQRFIDTLLLAVNQKSITLVFTLRADFYGYVLSYRPFSDGLQQIQFKPLGLMSREELQRAIEQPAQKLNVQLQTHLAQRILDDVGQEPGNLPLLEFALTQLWLKQNDNELTHKAYDEIGGIKQALIKHAELIYHKLSDTQQKQAQGIFLQLVRLGEDTEDTRRVATLEEVGKENWELIAYLAGGESRLVVTGRNDKSEQETVEVVHEALIREWGRLRQWVNENRQNLIQQRKIETGAIEWRDKNKSKDYLLGDKQLNEFQVFQKEQSTLLRLSPLAYEFIQKSLYNRRNNLIRLISFGFIPIIFLTFYLADVGYWDIRTSHFYNEVEKAKGQKESYPRIKALEELVKLSSSLNKIDLSGADLSGAVLINADLSGAKLSNADLSRAVLSRAYLSRAHLSGAHLNDAFLSGANLSYADLSGVLLSSANFSSADLSGAKLSNADLSGANLKDAQLGCLEISDREIRCTDLRDAKNLTPKQVKQAKNWQEAIYDQEFRKKLGLPPEKKNNN